MIDDYDTSDGDVKVIKCLEYSRSHVVHGTLKDNTFAIRDFYLLKEMGKIRAHAYICSSKIHLNIFLFLQKLNNQK